MKKGLAQAYDNLATLLDAGVPIIRSLNTVTQGLRDPLKHGFARTSETVSKGVPLAEAMQLSPKVFVPLDVMIVNAAETSGNLAESLDLLAKWHAFSNRIKKRIISALVLPFLVLHIAAAVAPAPAFVLGGFHVGPYLRSAMIILSLLYVPTLIIVAIMRFTPQTGIARRKLDAVSLWVPALGKALYNLALSRFCSVFHMLSKAGVPIVETAEMATSATGNVVVADLFRPAAKSVRAGNLFSEGLSTKLPGQFLEPWRVGEETGRSDEIAKKLAEKNAEAAEFWFKEFAQWFPRFVYLIVAVIMIHQIFKLAGAAFSGTTAF